MFGGRVFQQTVDIPMGTNCAPLRADLFLYSYDADSIQRLLKNTKKSQPDPLISLSAIQYQVNFGDFVDRIYAIELEIKHTTDTDRSASYLDLNPEIDSGRRLRSKLYDKRDDFNFPL